MYSFVLLYFISYDCNEILLFALTRGKSSQRPQVGLLSLLITTCGYAKGSACTPPMYFTLHRAKSANLCQFWQNHATFCKLLQTLLRLPQTFGKCKKNYCKVLKALSSQNGLHLFSLAYKRCSKQSFPPPFYPNLEVVLIFPTLLTQSNVSVVRDFP